MSLFASVVLVVVGKSTHSQERDPVVFQRMRTARLREERLNLKNLMLLQWRKVPVFVHVHV